MRPFLLLATFILALAAIPAPGHADVRSPCGVAVIIGNKTYQCHDILLAVLAPDRPSVHHDDEAPPARQPLP